MTTVSMVEFRKNGKGVLQRVLRGQRLLLTYRGKPVAHLVPVRAETPPMDDPFYSLHTLADGGVEGLSNSEMDRILYEA